MEKLKGVLRAITLARVLDRADGERLRSTGSGPTRTSRTGEYGTTCCMTLN
jgi:hypothetical protein